MTETLDLSKVKKLPNQPTFEEVEKVQENVKEEEACAGSFKVSFDKLGNVTHVFFYNRDFVTPRKIEEACLVAIVEWQKQGISTLYADKPNKI
jgi:hypothetical protein